MNSRVVTGCRLLVHGQLSRERLTYRACTTADDLVERQSIGDTIWAAGRGADGVVRALRDVALLCVDGTARGVDICRTAVAKREDHLDDTQARGQGCSRGTKVTRRELWRPLKTKLGHTRTRGARNGGKGDDEADAGKECGSQAAKGQVQGGLKLLKYQNKRSLPVECHLLFAPL